MGTIRVQTLHQNAYAGIRISDNGPGHSPRKIETGFQSAFHHQAARQWVGMAVAHDAIQEMEGKIDVKSQVGEGAEFTIWIPVYQ